MLVSVDSPAASLCGFVPDDADLDGVFPLICVETGARFDVQGWACEVRASAPHPFALTEAETIAAVYSSFAYRRVCAGALGWASDVGSGAVRVRTSRSDVVIRSTGQGWSVTAGAFEGVDADLERAASLALNP